MTRLRKAWGFSCPGLWLGTDILYAPTRQKAKGQALARMLDAGYDASDAFECMRIHRAPASDIHLPEPHRLLSDLDEKDRSIITHSFGVQGNKHGWRGHFCTCPSNRRLLRLAWEFGLFSGPHGEKAYGETPGWAGAFFYLTDLGKAVALSMVPTYPEGRA